MANSTNINNSLYGIVIGSVIDGLTGQINATVVKGQITQMVSQQAGSAFMSGKSEYVYTDMMNQGSLSIEGSYGVSGVAKYSGGISAYAGKTSANSKTAVSVDYNAIAWGGIEYIDFDNLTIEDFINGLSVGTKAAILSVLDAYLAVKNELTKVGGDLLQNVYSSVDPKYNTLKALFTTWIAASNLFRTTNADGVVVGVLWGGLGTVHLDMDSTQSQTQLKYGGAGNFSYSGVGSSVSVKATYDGSQSNKNSAVTVSSSSNYSGGCMKQVVADWFKTVSANSWTALADVKVVDSAPTLNNGAVTTPTAPPFITPDKDPGVSGKIAAIKDLKGLEVYAQAAAFDKAKQKDSTLTLDAFLKNSKQPVDTSGLDAAREQINNQTTNTLEDIDPPGENAVKPMAVVPESTLAVTDAPNTDYVPLGIWIANWADLFPWLATGFHNDIAKGPGNDDQSGSIIKARTMLQDFLTLSQLYTGVAKSILNFFDDTPIADIGDAFSNAAEKLIGCFTKVGTIEKGMQDAFNGLSDHAKAIYTKWNELSFLRNCELGMGLLIEFPNPATPATRADSPSTKLRSVLSPPQNSDLTFHTSECDFNSVTQNSTAFKKFVKGYPVITPNGDIYMFVSMQVVKDDGTNDEVGGFLLGVNSQQLAGQQELFFLGSSLTDKTFVGSFTSNATEQKLTSTCEITDSNGKFISSINVNAYPIPFTAAEGLSDWTGASMSTNLKSFKGLNNRLNEIQTQLSLLNSWSFSSETFSTLPWNGGACYSIKTLKVSYLGIVEEVGNTFTKQ